MAAEQLRRQYIIAGLASLVVANAGYSMGWTSPVNVILEDPEQSPLPEPITTDQGAWIGSLLNLGCMCGTFIGAFLSSRIGRKWTLLSISVPFLVGWVLITIATNVAFIYAGRILTGIGVGMIFTASMYCAEISTVDARGALGTYLQLFMTFGTLLMYVIGPFMTYNGISYVGIAFTSLFAITFIFMPESPFFYLIKIHMGNLTCLSVVYLALIISDVFRGKNFKAFYIGCLLVVFQQLSGIHAVLYYMTDIFRAAGTTLEPAYATIIVGAIQFLASCTTQFIVDRLKRRILLMISSCGSAVGLGLLGTYFLLADLKSPILEYIDFLPLFSLVLYMNLYCWGLGALPFAIIAEIMPIEVKTYFTAFASLLGTITSFLILRFFGVIAEAVGHYVVFWIFAGSCVACFFFALFVLPESKGKTFSEIQDMLAGRKSTEKDPASL